jgi:hypothetical protein
MLRGRAGRTKNMWVYKLNFKAPLASLFPILAIYAADRTHARLSARSLFNNAFLSIKGPKNNFDLLCYEDRMCKVTKIPSGQN